MAYQGNRTPYGGNFNIPGNETAFDRLMRGMLSGLGTGLSESAREAADRGRVQQQQPPIQSQQVERPLGPGFTGLQSRLESRMTPEQREKYLLHQLQQSEKNVFDRLSPEKQWDIIAQRLKELKRGGPGNKVAEDKIPQAPPGVTADIPEGETGVDEEAPISIKQFKKIEAPGELYNRLVDEEHMDPAEAKRRADIYKTDFKAKYGSTSKKKAEVKEHLSKLRQNSKDAKQNLDRLSRMREIIKKFNLPPATSASFIRALKRGIDVGMYPGFHGHIPLPDLTPWLGADAEEFIKLTNDFVKNIRNVFPGRVTNKDLEVFMGTIPNLLMSDEGKARVIHNLEIQNKSEALYYAAAKEIIAQNNGKLPKNLDDLIERKISKKLDRLSQEFIKGIDYAKEYLGREERGELDKGSKKSAETKDDRLYLKGPMSNNILQMLQDIHGGMPSMPFQNPLKGLENRLLGKTLAESKPTDYGSFFSGLASAPGQILSGLSDRFYNKGLLSQALKKR